MRGSACRCDEASFGGDQLRSDIPALVAYFLAEKAGGRRLSISPEAMSVLERYDWPGNVRELRNAIEHAVAVCAGSQILPQHLPRTIVLEDDQPPVLPQAFDEMLAAWLDSKLEARATYREMHDEIETLALRDLPLRFDGKLTVLARETKMNRVTLRRKWRELGSEE